MGTFKDILKDQQDQTMHIK